MLSPCYVKLRYWFYPIGNTPAVNLLRDRATSSDSHHRILCLASGDVRNLLYTIWAEPSKRNGAFEFTTCDSEPAVIARNIFLLSYLISIEVDSKTTLSEHSAVLWKLYYHFFIDSATRDQMIQHSRRLLEVSTSLDTWTSSAYGAILGFLSKDTLSEVREYWRLYLDLGDDARHREVRTRIEEIFARYRASGQVLTGNRSTGIHLICHATTITSAFRAYWKTGVVAGNKRDVAALKHEMGGHVNPLFSISSASLGQFAVHYGTDPLLGFHLAETFDDKVEEATLLERLAENAKIQFRSWCESFMHHANARTVRINFHCGEALSLSYRLHERISACTGIPRHLHTYFRPWSSLPLDLTEETRFGSAYFDVIDTSNISDHVGILNLLPAAVPLLDRSMGGVLYTETLLRAADDSSQYLDELLRANANTVYLLTGLAPTASMTGRSTEHFGLEAIMAQLGQNRGSQSQMRMRIAWRRPDGGDCNVLSSGRISSPLLAADPE